MRTQETSSGWSYLPATVFDKLVSCVSDNEDVKVFRLVCRNWHDAVSDRLSHLRPRRFRNEEQSIGACFSELQSLDVSVWENQGLCLQSPTAAAFSQLTSLTRLQSLILDNHKYIPASGLQLLSVVRSLRSLSLRGVQLTPESLAATGVLTQLQSVDLSHSSCCSSLSLQFVSKLVNLRVLCLQGCGLILRPHTLHYLSRMTSLLLLDFGWCLQDQAVPHLLSLPSLLHFTLGLARAPISMDSLAAVGRWSNANEERCVHVNVRGDFHCSLSCMRALAAMPGLRHIKFHHGMYDSDAVGLSLPTLTSLHSLDLCDCYLHLYDDNLHLLATLTQLQQLHVRLGGGFVTHTGLKSLSKLTNLVFLRIIGFDSVTDDVMYSWTSSLVHLRGLCLGDEESRWRPGKLPVSDAAFQSLTKLSSLTTLRVCGMPDLVTSFGVFKTLQGLSNLKDLTMHGLPCDAHGAELSPAVHLTKLDVSFNSFDDESLPASMGRLTDLRHLVLGECYCLSMWGVVNAVHTLDRLKHLDLIGASRFSYELLEEALEESPLHLPASLRVLMISGREGTAWKP